MRARGSLQQRAQGAGVLRVRAQDVAQRLACGESADALIQDFFESRLVCHRVNLLRRACSARIWVTLTAPSVLFDAVAIVVAPQASKEIAKSLLACTFVADAYAHCKFIAYTADARPLLERALGGSPLDGGCKQVETGIAAGQFAALCAQLRFWTRERVVGL